MYDLSAPENGQILRLMWVGNTDFVYKYEHGYMSFSLGSQKSARESAGSYYFIWKLYWNHGYGKLTLHDLPALETEEAPEEEPEINTTIVHTTFESSSVTPDDVKANVDGVLLNNQNKTGVTFESVKDGSGNTYIKLMQTSGASDPAVSMTKGQGLDGALMGYTSLIVSVRLAVLEGVACPSGKFRLRATSANDSLVLFTTDTSGNVFLLGNTDMKITTLGKDFQAVSVSVDFVTGETVGYLDGEEVVRGTATVPQKSTAGNLLEWLSTIPDHFFNWYFSGSSAERILLFDDIRMDILLPEGAEEEGDSDESIPSGEGGELTE